MLRWIGRSFFIFFIPFAYATSVIPMTLKDLINQSSVVVHGKVVQIEVNPEGYRSACVEALEVIRAPENFQNLRDFHVPLLNRGVPRSDLVEYVPSAPEFQNLEEVLLFLEPVPPSEAGFYQRLDAAPLFTLTGFYQGKYRVLEDAAGVRRVAAWNEIPEPKISNKDLLKAKTSLRFSLKTPSLSIPLDAEKILKLQPLNQIMNQVREDSGP